MFPVQNSCLLLPCTHTVRSIALGMYKPNDFSIRKGMLICTYWDGQVVVKGGEAVVSMAITVFHQ